MERRGIRRRKERGEGEGAKKKEEERETGRDRMSCHREIYSNMLNSQLCINSALLLQHNEIPFRFFFHI